MSLQHAFRGAGSREVTNKNGANAVLNNEPKKVAGTRTTACKDQANRNKLTHTNLHTGRGTWRSPPHRSHKPGCHQCTHGPVSRGTGMVNQNISKPQISNTTMPDRNYFTTIPGSCVPRRRSLPRLGQPTKDPLQART